MIEQDCTAKVEKLSDLDGIAESIDSLNSKLEKLLHQFSQRNDHLYGSQPECGNEGVENNPSGKLNMLQKMIDSSHQYADALDGENSRQFNLV